MAKTISGTTISGGYTLTNAAYTPFFVAAGAGLTNASGTALVNQLAAGWSIDNTGLIAGAGTAGIGIDASNAGTVGNEVGGSIAGYSFGVSLGAAGTVLNHGLISATKTSGNSSAYFTGPPRLTATSAGVATGGGRVVNYAGATISGSLSGVGLNGVGTLVNSGSILSGTSVVAGYGVIVGNGGAVTNQSGGLIGAGKFGVVGFGGVAVSNNSGGTISAAGVGVATYYQPATIVNSGKIAGVGFYGVRLNAGGSVDNAASDATISGAAIGILVAGATGSVSNLGSILSTAAVGGTGLLLNAGGTLTNLSSGKIASGGYGVNILNGVGTVDNFGTISSTRTFNGAGVNLRAGGTVINEGATTLGPAGQISARWIGVQFGRGNINAGGTLINSGTIQATDGANGAAVWIHGNGVVINNVGGVIEGATAGTVSGGPLNGVAGGPFGIVAYYTSTIVNRGIIGGSAYSVDFTTNNTTQTATGGLIEIAPGATFQGVVLGASNGNTGAGKASNAYAALGTLQLLSGASAGTIAGFGSHYRNFGNVVIDVGAQWNLGGTVGAETTITFASGGDSSLTLASAASMLGTIAGFRAGDTLSLEGITTTSGLFPMTMDSSDLLTLTGSGIVLQFDSSATGRTFSQSVSGGQTSITVSCFARGTSIETPDGPVKVEDLREGQKVATHAGEAATIVWIGQRDIDCRRHPDPASILPVRVHAWAFGRGMPSRDLLLSPDHAVYREGVLVPIRCLINGTSVRQETVAKVSYFHIELPEHDVILAENLPVESYLDTGDRGNFANGGQPMTLFPNFAARRWEMAGCAPLILAGPKLEEVKRRMTPRLNSRYTYY